MAEPTIHNGYRSQNLPGVESGRIKVNSVAKFQIPAQEWYRFESGPYFPLGLIFHKYLMTWHTCSSDTAIETHVTAKQLEAD